MDVRLDMSMMLAMHDALRRELVQVGRIAARRDDHPGRRLHAALGWELFKKSLTVHHQAEDDALWPPLRARVAGQPDQVALVDALEAEHAAIGPLLAATDAAAADPDRGDQRFGDVIDEPAGRLTAHLAHEETGGLPLIDASLTPAGWQHFAQVHTERVRGDAGVPALAAGRREPADARRDPRQVPPPLLSAFRGRWGPSYAALAVWPAGGEPGG
jgi:Hemerythrin HHE cation binding domain